MFYFQTSERASHSPGTYCVEQNSECWCLYGGGRDWSSVFRRPPLFSIPFLCFIPLLLALIMTTFFLPSGLLIYQTSKAIALFHSQLHRNLIKFCVGKILRWETNNHFEFVQDFLYSRGCYSHLSLLNRFLASCGSYAHFIDYEGRAEGSLKSHLRSVS